MLFNRANSGANGKAATNIVTKPYCKTEIRGKHKGDTLICDQGKRFYKGMLRKEMFYVRVGYGTVR